MTSANVDIVQAPEGPTGTNADPLGCEENIESTRKTPQAKAHRVQMANAENGVVSASSEDSSENDNYEPRRKSSRGWLT